MLRYSFFILLMTLSFCAFASGDTAIMKHFNIENGLPSNNVYAVTQDNLGYIWFNTDNGIVKYNGYTFKLFTISDGLPSNDVWKLFPDKRGRLWVHTHSNKIGYIKNDKYKVVMVSADKAIHPSFISCDSNNVYFLYGPMGHMSLLIVDSNDHIEMHLIDSGGKNILSSISYDNTLLLAKWNDVIYTRNLSKDNSIVNSRKMDFSIYSFVAEGGDMVYYNGMLLNISAIHNYILVVDSNRSNYNKVYFDAYGGKRNERVYTNYTRNDSLVIHTDKAIYLFDRYMRWSRRIDIVSLIPNALQVSYYATDSYKNEWYATTSDGAWCNSSTSGLFEIHKKLSVLAKSKRIGTLPNGDTYWFDKTYNVLYKLTASKFLQLINLPNNDLLRKIEYRNDSEVYFCSDKGIYIYNLKSKKYVSIVKYYSLNTVKKINQILEPPVPISHDTSIINGSFINTKWLHQININKWLLYNLGPILETIEIINKEAIIRTLDVEHYTKIWYDAPRNLYFFSNSNKAAIYNPVKNEYITFDSHFLSELRINSIGEIISDASNIYILDNDKIVMINVKKRSFKTIRCNFNLSDAYMSMYNNTLIVAGKFGLAFTSLNELASPNKFKVAINRNNYNRIYDFTVNTTGQIYIATDKGFVDIEIKDLLNNKELFDPTKSNFFKLVLSYPEQRNILNSDTIILSQKLNKINLDGINNMGNGDLNYYYIIEKYNAGWQQTTTGNVYIGGIKSNHYYKVRCIAKDNFWISNELVFYIYKEPYWWQTARWDAIFWICGSILFLGLTLSVILLTRYVVARSNEKKRVLTELELRAIYAQINPNFIFNTLSAALYFINRKKFDDAYIHVNKFSKLIRGYLKSSQDRYIILAEEIEMLKNYIELQRTRFEGSFEYELKIDNKLPIQNIKLPSLLLQPLVENAINDGLFNKTEAGFLLIEFIQGQSSDELICIIEDNGVGREKAKEIKRKNNSVNTESYSTKLTKQLIAVFKEFENMDISIEYIDKKMPEQGTTIKLIIKNIKYVA